MTSIQTGRRGADTEWIDPTPMWIKIQRAILGAKGPRPTPRAPAQDSRIRKNPYNFWLQKPAGIESVEETARAPTSSSWRTHTQTHLLSPSELQHQGSSLKGTVVYREKLKCLQSRQAEAIVPLLKPPPHGASKLMPYLRLHQLLNTLTHTEIPKDSASSNI